MALPDNPLSREEQYLNRIATGRETIPDEPLSRAEQYLDYIAKNGGSGGGDSGSDGTLEEILTFVSDGSTRWLDADNDGLVWNTITA